MVSGIADSGADLLHYSRTVPNPGGVVDLEVLKFGIPISPKSMTAQSARSSSPTGAQAASWVETNGRLRVTWNAKVEPYLSVVFIALNGSRTVLGQQLETGTAILETDSLPASGHFELSFASRLSARLVTTQRAAAMR
jgi:hypothetical protein